MIVMDIFSMLTFGILLISTYLLWMAHRSRNFWREKNIPCIGSYPFIGNTLDVILKRKSFWDVIRDILTQLPNEKLIGINVFTKPILIVNDKELSERVLVEDFQHFSSRINLPEDIKAHEFLLFTMSGEKWRALRQKLVPMFTNVKMKKLFSEFIQIAEKAVKKFEGRIADGIELKSYIDEYLFGAVSVYGFGLQEEVLANANNESGKMGRTLLENNWTLCMRRLIWAYVPEWAYKLKLTFNTTEAHQYFSDFTKLVVQQRKIGGFEKDDMLQHIMNIVAGKDYSSECRESITTAYAMTILSAGLDDVSLSILYLCYELSFHQDVQDKLREELLDVMKKNDGILNYDGLRNASYLDMCIDESSRLHTVAPQLIRTCTRTYSFPGTDLTIEPGQMVYIPSMAFHLNPENYAEPYKFDPERFRVDFKPSKSTFLPFGNGPRICIGMRLAVLQIKLFVSSLIINYRLKPNPIMKPVQSLTTGFFLTPSEALLFDLEKL